MSFLLFTERECLYEEGKRKTDTNRSYIHENVKFMRESLTNRSDTGVGGVQFLHLKAI